MMAIETVNDGTGFRVYLPSRLLQESIPNKFVRKETEVGFFKTCKLANGYSL